MLTRDLSPQFVLIYNGARCGASAPDHLHFQAFPSQNLPLEAQLLEARNSSLREIVVKREDILVAAPMGFSRHFVTFRSNNATLLSSWVHQTLEALGEAEGSAAEPMINLVMVYKEDGWEVILFPRSKHRPRCYDDGQDGQLVISPGAIDMAGVFVIPRKKDYERVNAETLNGIYQEVTLPEDRFSRLIEKLREKK
jgi:hypothetical protein